jgi:hypothetical protein
VLFSVGIDRVDVIKSIETPNGCDRSKPLNHVSGEAGSFPVLAAIFHFNGL